MNTLKAGFAEKILTKSDGLRLAGYAEKRLATGVHDDLHARCIVLEKGDLSVALVSASILYLKNCATETIRTKASEQTGIPANNIVVHTTHTHSGPDVEGEFEKFVIEQCVASIVEACNNTFDAQIGAGITHTRNCGMNRRYLDYGGLPIDDEVAVLRIDDLHGNTKGILFNYACHCTTLGASNTLVSADWPSYAIQAIKQQLGDNVFAVFFNGACGDINPGYSAALSAVSAQIPIRTWEKAQEIGERVAESALAKWAEISTSPDIELKIGIQEVELPCRKSFPVSRAEALEGVEVAKEDLKKVEEKTPVFQRPLERARARVFLAELLLSGVDDFEQGKIPDTTNAILQSVRIGDAAITTLPGEIFCEIGMAVKKASPSAKNFIFELVNNGNAFGYMPAASAYGEGDYEAYKSIYAENAGEVLANASVTNLKKLWD